MIDELLEKAERLGLTVRRHNNSWWVYDKEYDSDTGPYPTEQEAWDWIMNIDKSGKDDG